MACEGLEPRALLSGSTSALPQSALAVSAEVRTNAIQISDPDAVNLFYQSFLKRGAESSGEAYWLSVLDAGVSQAEVAKSILTSKEYTQAHPRSSDFVSGLYSDVLERVPTAGAVRHWTRQLDRGEISRGALARVFLKADSSILNEIKGGGGGGGVGGAFGSVNSVTVSPGGTSATSGSTAYVGLIFNKNDLGTRTITISVSGAGTYTLNQTQSWGATNNTGKAWTGYRLVLQTSQSTAKPTLSSTSDASGQLPKVSTSSTSTSTTATFSGGKVPSSNSTKFQPLTTLITTASAGTIVIQQTPLA